MLETFFGCDCYCIDHIAHMSYYPPEKNEKIDEEDNVIYLTVNVRNYFNRILPPIFFNPFSLFNWKCCYEDYFYLHILKRLPIGLSYIFNPYYKRKDGILNCFDFQNKDLPAMRDFLSHLTNKETIVNKDVYFSWDNDRWLIKFDISRIDEDMPWWLGWEIQFLPRKIFGRIEYALRYIFSRHCDEQSFEINEERAIQIKGLITAVEKLNEERYEKNTTPRS